MARWRGGCIALARDGARPQEAGAHPTHNPPDIRGKYLGKYFVQIWAELGANTLLPCALARYSGVVESLALGRGLKQQARAEPTSLLPQASILNPLPSSLNPQPSTLLPPPSTLYPKPETRYY